MNINHPTTEQLGALRRLWKEAFGDLDPLLDAFFPPPLIKRAAWR